KHTCIINEYRLSLIGFPAADVGREKRSMPNWHAGYEKIEDLSRTFWAHFPSASHLGPYQETQSRNADLGSGPPVHVI
uniref:Si:ch73-23l24.1 n=1 Tax=Oncorhynchus kisutch TaxID=8019 RepID=A0A8C7FI61_ONCKI